ncbi:hypothetical protein STAFG_8338 [Streptomyces afghaniensis 772]|uniref:Uncharacterized protein n=1 Tax=Streptomyces afghaniensis 772 TaxID=1283301 RepID=S4MDX3_9ACTN|nr:hypothetical protein STAFG_8338 [Streptomyces afghaniensis 772]
MPYGYGPSGTARPSLTGPRSPARTPGITYARVLARPWSRIPEKDIR